MTISPTGGQTGDGAAVDKTRIPHGNEPSPSAEISPNDEMFAGSLDHYFTAGRRALDSVRLSLAAAEVEGEPRRILDLPCGHGRVLRSLRAAYPQAEIVACDLNEDGVRFCAERFDAVPLISSQDPRDIALEGEFDLIWCGSLLTHLDTEEWEQFIDLFRRHLSPQGVIVFTVNGPWTAELLRIAALGDPAEDQGGEAPSPSAGLAETAQSYFPLPLSSRRSILADYARSGFGYAEYENYPDYGLSVSSPKWVTGMIERFRDTRLVLYTERGWDHQDVVACAHRATALAPLEA